MPGCNNLVRRVGEWTGYLAIQALSSWKCSFLVLYMWAMNVESCAKQLRLINKQIGACDLGESLDCIFHKCNWVQWNCYCNCKQIETMNKLAHDGYAQFIGKQLHSELLNKTQFRLVASLPLHWQKCFLVDLLCLKGHLWQPEDFQMTGLQCYWSEQSY